MQQMAAEIDRDIPVVSSVWGTGWSRRVVMLVPATEPEFAAITGASGDVSDLAALSTAELPPAPEGLPAPVGNRVVINPMAFAGLSIIGRTVVVTHEITHVASRAFTGPDLPRWLIEGLADYVGFLDSGLSVPVVAQELAVRLGAGYLPSGLPDDAAFSASDPNLASVYEQAWMATRLIVAKVGQRGLIRLYRLIGTAAPAADGGQAVVAADVAAVLGESLSTFTAQWRASLVAQLG
jgi:hypothetical protein